MSSTFEEQTAEGDLFQSILETDLTGVDLTPTVLKGGTYDLVVADMKFEEKKDKTGRQLLIVVKTEYPAVSTKDKEVPAGFTISERISGTPTEKLSRDDIEKRLKRVRVALTGQESGQFLPLSQYIGAKFQGLIDIEVDNTGQYSDKNRIKRWIRK